MFTSKITGLKLGKKCSHPISSFFPHPTLPAKWLGSMAKKIVTHSQAVKGKENYYSKCNSLANHNSLLEQPAIDSSNLILTFTFIGTFFKSLKALEQILLKLVLAIGR